MLRSVIPRDEVAAATEESRDPYTGRALISECGSHRLLIPLTARVLPTGVGLVDERNLLFPPPVLQLLLAANCGSHFAIGLLIQQPIDLVLRRESARCVVLVLSHAERQIAGNANVKRAAEASEYVYRIAMFASGSHICCAYRGPSTPRSSSFADDLVAQDDREKGVAR